MTMTNRDALLSDDDVESALSIAYVQAIAAQAGYTCGEPPGPEACEAYVTSQRHAECTTKGGLSGGTMAVLNEFYRVAFCKKVYCSIDELQADLDVGIREYNEKATSRAMVLRQNAYADLP